MVLKHNGLRDKSAMVCIIYSASINPSIVAYYSTSARVMVEQVIHLLSIIFCCIKLANILQ